MNYERLAGAPKYSEGRAAARYRRHKAVVERKMLEKAARAEDREKRRAARLLVSSREIERKTQEERARRARYEKEREEKRQRRIMRENRVRMERDRRVKRLLIAAIQSQGKRPRTPVFQSEEKRAQLAAWREQKRLRHEEWRRNGATSIYRDSTGGQSSCDTIKAQVAFERSAKKLSLRERERIAEEQWRQANPEAAAAQDAINAAMDAAQQAEIEARERALGL